MFSTCTCIYTDRLKTVCQYYINIAIVMKYCPTYMYASKYVYFPCTIRWGWEWVVWAEVVYEKTVHLNKIVCSALANFFLKKVKHV